ncbi:MAG: DUF433 domain-containing protein [Gaiellaceae bacterium]
MATQPKGDPFSVRFSGPTDRAIEAEAKRLKRSKSAIVESLAEEAMRMRRFPGIGFMGDDAGRRAVVTGTGFDVWQLIETLRNYPSPESVVKDFPRVELRHIRLAEAYYEAYPDEVDARVAENNRPIEELLELYPFVQFHGTRR